MCPSCCGSEVGGVHLGHDEAGVIPGGSGDGIEDAQHDDDKGFGGVNVEEKHRSSGHKHGNGWRREEKRRGK